MSEPGRRSATSRVSLHPTALIGIALVVLSMGALLLVQPFEPASRAAGPDEAVLTAASVGCPTALAGAESVAVATGLDSVAGKVRLGAGDGAQKVPVSAGRVTAVDDQPGPVAVTGSGELAPALLAARFGATELAGVDCPSPRPETWFTGVGASGASHASTLELVNPDQGPAVADIAVFSPRGPIDVPELRGVTVSGGESATLDLAEVMPRRGELALRVVVTRGRLAASLLDRIPELGSQQLTEDWLAGQAAPTTRSLMLGLARGEGTDQLAVANPGEDEARVTVRIVTPDSVFVPAELDELRVAPGRVRTASLTAVVRKAVAEGAIGVEVSSNVPVTSSMRSLVGGDLFHPVPVDPVEETSPLLVPPGAGSVVLADADGVGAAVVEAWTSAGRALEEQQVELKPGQGAVVDLPRGAALVRVTPSRTSVHAAALVSGPAGATALGFREPVTDALIPDVRPGLP